MAAWLDYAGKHPLPDDGSMAPPADVVPDVAPQHAYPDQAYPDGCDGPGEQVVYTGWRWVYNMLRAQVANYGTNDVDGVWERRNALGSQRVKILQDVGRLKAPCCTAMDWIFIPAYCFAIP